MTSGSRLIRGGQLRDVLLNVRQARRALAAKDIAKAIHFYGYAVAGLHFSCGIWHETTISATATLRKVVTGLGLEIEDAVAPAPRVEASDLIPILYNGLKVLQARGVEVEDELLLDRARNQAMAVAGHFVLTAIEPAPSGCPQPPHSGEVGAN